MEARVLSLRHAAGRTPIVVGPGVLGQPPPALAEAVAGRTLFVVSDRPVWELHGARLDDVRRRAAASHLLHVPSGEQAKTLHHAEDLWNRLLEAGGKRDSVVIGFGGGSVCDLAGFVAACFLRGVDLVLLPTTLLAQVDAAIGGKTAVDLPGGKNTVGAFHHPRAVVADVEVLHTLPPREVRSGIVEALKSALILDPPLMASMEADLDRLLALDPEVLTPLVAAAAAVKARVVEEDPREADRRRLLNFGHTLGHALESALGYRGLLHGEAVAYGVLFALRLAEARGPGWIDRRVGDRMRALLARLELPPLPVGELAVDDLVARMGRDKKAREDGLVWVLPASTGDGGAEGRMVGDVTSEEVRRQLAAFLAEPFGTADGGRTILSV